MSRKILIVDDEAPLLAALRRQLHADFDICTAQNGETALKALEEDGPFAVVVSDMRMPGMDGAHLLEAVSRRSPDTVRIMLTGCSDQETAIQAINAGGIFRFLTKPCPAEVLRDAVEQALIQYTLVTKGKEHVKKFYDQLAQAQDLLQETQMLSNSVPDALYMFNLDMTLVKWNTAMESMTGLDADQLLGRTFQSLFDPDEQANSEAAIREVLDKDVASIESCWIAGGASVPVLLNLAALRDDENEAVGIVGSAHDITYRKTLERELREIADTDDLTGISNRRHFLEIARHELKRAKRFHRSLSVVMLDVDHFKAVNDTRGHAVGDDVLRTLAHTCLKALRDMDVIGRYGGEEFAILLLETDEKQAFKVTERLRKAVQKMAIDTDAGPVRITVSQGIATATGAESDIPELLARADTALYAAKNNGRNRVEVDSAPALKKAKAGR